MATTMDQETEIEPAKIVIVGAGIVGLVLALALKKHVGIKAEIYEKAGAFHDDVGAALGFYPNGLRVLRDIDLDLLHSVKRQGYPYLYRRWGRHDGTEIATADESELSSGDEELYSIGIRRWRLQKALFRAVEDAGIPLYYSKATMGVVERDEDDLIQVLFEDGTSRATELLFATDGGKSTVRSIVADPKFQLKYTGVTCLMGISNRSADRRGIDFPSSTTSEFHAVYFPTGKNEQCFQIHFPIDEHVSDKTTWGNLSPAEGKEQFEDLAERLKDDGWHERYTAPLSSVEHAVRVGFALLEPRLDRWVYGKNDRIVLVGDSAHPPVPYVGQGAQMGVEDAGTVALLIKHLCTKEERNVGSGDEPTLDWTHFSSAMRIYQRLRIPRTSSVLDISKRLGSMQDARSHEEQAALRELFIQGEVLMNGTLPEMCPGSMHDYRRDVMDAIMDEFAKRHDRDILDTLMRQGEKLFDEEDGMIGPGQYHNEDLLHLLNSRQTYDPKMKQLLFEEVLARY